MDRKDIKIPQILAGYPKKGIKLSKDITTFTKVKGMVLLSETTEITKLNIVKGIT